MATTSVLAKLIVAISAQNAEFNRALSSSQKQLQSFQKGLASVGQALGITFGAAAVVSGIKQVIGLTAEFEHTMSTLKAITGSTGDEFKKLRDDAIRLGSATKFTANEVGQLQIAFGRLGFNTKEILDATEATLALAAATGEDLAKSADVAGSTVRGFGLEAKETQRVVDVMAKSFNTTALGLDNFAESMKYVAPIANAANASVEETTALLGVLADSGIRGSSAGTALRKIFGELSRDGRPLSERLKELGEKGLTLSDAYDEVGRTAQTALLVLTKNTDKNEQLAKSFQNVTGEAEAMARVMQDDLIGDAEKLSSAFEGLILKLSKTDALRDLTQALTALVTALGDGQAEALSGLDMLARGLRDGVQEANGGFQLIIDKLRDLRRETGKPIDTRIAQELADKYKLTEEQANILYRTIIDINKSLSFQEQVIATFQDFASGYKDVASAAELYKEGLYKLILAEQVNQSQLEKTAAANKDAATALQPEIDASKKLISSYYERIRIINEYTEAQGKSEKKVKENIEGTVLNLNFYQDALKKVNDAFNQVALSQGQFGELAAEAASQLRILAAEAAGLDNFIKKVNAIKESFRDLDVVIKPPDTTALTNALTTIQESAGALTFEREITSFEAAIGRFEAGLAKLARKTKETTSTIKEEFVNFSGIVTSALSGIGQAIGSALGGGESFGKALLGVLGGILTQLGEMLIAAGVGVEAFKTSLNSLNGYVAIAAGVALVALGSFIGTKIKGLGSSGAASPVGVSSVGSSGSRSNVTTEAQDVRLKVDPIIIRGQDMYVILQAYQGNNKFTKANG